MALTATMLKTANSPFFGLRTKVETAQSAVTTMGINTALGIVIGIALKNAIGGKNPMLERFWVKAEKVAMIASFLSGKVSGVPMDIAYMYGLFRDCGIPMMLHNFPEYSKKLMNTNTGTIFDFTLVEDESFKTKHTKIGYLLAKNWTLPKSICEAVLHHNKISTLHSNEELSAEARGLIAVNRFAEFLFDSFEQRENHEWEASGSIVLSYLGLSDDDFNGIKKEVFQFLA
jgi:HD-like signal output (HDOD) protein